MTRCFSIFTIFLLVMASVATVIADESEAPSDWVDVDDSGDWQWLDEINPFDWKRANRLTITSIPNYYPVDVDSVIEQIPTRFAPADSATGVQKIHSTSDVSPNTVNPTNNFSLKLTTITGRKYGETTEDNLERYNGDPLSSTNRFAFTLNNFDCGMTLDKDAFEPHNADLSRFWARWQSDNTLMIFGDFHITIGRGVAVWTKPDYSSAFDNAASYRPSCAVVRSAGDSYTNSAFRGVATRYKYDRTSLTLFGAQTELDAISASDSSGLMLRLSATGLHRTIGEERKKNLVEESAGGGVISQQFSLGVKRSLELFLGGYAAEYSPGFSGESTPQSRFPLSGSHMGAVTSGLHFAGRQISSFAEVGADLTGRTAWSIAGTASLPSSTIGVDVAIFSTPKGFQSPRSRDPFEGSHDSGCDGAAIHLRGNPHDSVLDFWRAHLEIAHIPWRGYTVPTPSIRSRFSLEGGMKLSETVRLEMRYRRRLSDDGHGEESPVEQFSDQRSRARLHFDLANLGRQTVWAEGVRRDSNTRPQGKGFGCGMKQQIRTAISKRNNVFFSETISLVYYYATDGVIVYYGEASVPGRMRVVALSGEGWRWSGVTGLELGQICRIYLQAAQTISLEHQTEPDDIEIWAGITYYLNRAGSR